MFLAMASKAFAGVVMGAPRKVNMRSARPELLRIIRQVRVAAVWALAFSGVAALLGLAWPLLVLHAVGAVESKTSLDALMLVAAAVMAALSARIVLLQARQRLLTSTALWFEHVIGQQILARGLASCAPPNHLNSEQRQIENARKILAGPQILAALDAPFIILPLLISFALQPALAIITLVTAAVLVLSGLRFVSALAPLTRKSHAAHAIANGAWQTAAASSVAIEAREMTAGVVNDWQSLNARAISSDYALARRTASACRTVNICEALSPLLILSLGTGMALTEGLSLGAIIAISFLHQSVIRTLARLIVALPDLVTADLGSTRLMTGLPAQQLRGGASAGSPAEGVPPSLTHSLLTAQQPRRTASAGHP